MNASLREIVEQYLRENGFDGLYLQDECACAVDDLAPCDGPTIDCTAGYRAPCDCGEHDFHIQELRPTPEPEAA
jgi:hypothetical protein